MSLVAFDFRLRVIVLRVPYVSEAGAHFEAGEMAGLPQPEADRLVRHGLAVDAPRA